MAALPPSTIDEEGAMSRRFRFAIASLFVSLLSFAVGAGCGGSSMHPGTGTAGAGTGTGGAAGAGNRGGLLGAGNSIGAGNAAGTGTGGSTTGTGGTGTGTGGSSLGGAPMPTGTLVFQGDHASLLNNGAPCTAEAGASGDRWCGFFTP